MFNRGGIGREVIIFFIGAAISVLFGILVLYPEVLARSRENAARIESNREQIEMLWDAHEIRHETPTKNGG